MAAVGLRRQGPARPRVPRLDVPVALVWLGAVGLALVAAAGLVLVPNPLFLIPPALTGALLLVLGIESLIALAFLGAAGLLPFVDTGGYAVGNLPVWLFFFALGCGLMLLAWSMRVIDRRPSRPLEPNLLVVVLVVYFIFTVVRLAASEPLSIPSLSAQFVGFPAAALVTYLWLSHDEALAGLRRALPVIVLVVASWAAMYVAGSAGCEPCRAWVDTGRIRSGLLGGNDRLYTAGQNAFLGLVLIAFGQLLRRFTPSMAVLTLLGAAAIALQASRAQYFGFMAGALVLLVWKFWRVRVVGRVLLVLATGAGLAALLATPAGDRALSAYQEVTSQGGTAGFRFQILQNSSENWSAFGLGVFSQIFGKGFNTDLGLPNTLLVLGYFGGFLQIALLVLAAMRGALSRTLTGATVAGIFVMVLVARPTLPLIEYGHSGVAYGVALGFAAALHTRTSLMRRAPAALTPGR